jgi:hypothetical protein
MENVELEILPKDGEILLNALSKGHMIVARSKNEFLYVLDCGDVYQLFSHTPGAAGGNRKQVPKDGGQDALMRRLAEMSEHLYKAEFDKTLNIFGVMSCAEEGILSVFPGEERDSDGDIEFVFPGSSRE